MKAQRLKELTLRVLLILFLSSALFLINSKLALAAEYYVSPSGNDSYPGTQTSPWRTAAKASAVAQPGDVINFLSGTYTNQVIAPQRSGTADAPITFQSAPDHEAIFSATGADYQPIINLNSRSYINIKDLIIDGNWERRWISGDQTSNCVISGNIMRAAGADYGIKFDLSTYNRIINNRFEGQGGPTDGVSDILNVYAGHHNLIAHNYFINSHHAGLTIRDSDYNVIRYNYFSNEWEKNVNTNGGDIYDGSGGRVGDHNLWEGNRFATTQLSVDNQPSPGIQMELSHNIVRHNIFYENQGGGYRNEGYYDTAVRVINNRVYNNTFFNNHVAGIAYFKYQSGPQMYGNIYKNNILYKNSGSQILFDDNSQSTAETIINGAYFTSNSIFGNFPGDDVITGNGIGSQTLSWWQQNYSAVFQNNLEAEPQFVDEQAYNFNLQESSPLIDAGEALTRTRSSGAGTDIPVDDSWYFTDGFGLITGDQIMVGSGGPYTVTAVDYEQHVVSIDQSISWSNQEEVTLEYSGQAPDIGALESAYSSTEEPTPPPNSPTPPPNSPTPPPNSPTPPPNSPTPPPNSPTPPPGSELPNADITEDGLVDIDDYSIMKQELLKPMSEYRADFNKDGMVDIDDYSILKQQLRLF